MVDTTPPSMTLVRAEGISGDTLQVTLQLDEPGTVWCREPQATSKEDALGGRRDGRTLSEW